MKVIGCTWAAREYVATRDRGTRPVRHDMAKSISISLATSANQRDATTTYTSIFSWKRRERERERAKREGKGKRFPRRKFQPCARSLYSLATTKRLRFQRIDGIPIGKARGGGGWERERGRRTRRKSRKGICSLKFGRTRRSRSWILVRTMLK